MMTMAAASACGPTISAGSMLQQAKKQPYMKDNGISSRLLYITNRRTDMFMALILVLSMVLSGLEYTTGDGYDALSVELADDDVDNFEMLPVVEMDSPVAVVAPEVEPRSAEIEVVDMAEQADTLPSSMPEYIREELADVGRPADIPPTSIDGAERAGAQPLITLSMDETYPLRAVEQLPQFPGGQSAFVEWLTKRLKFPVSAERHIMKAQVVASFVVEKDGTVSSVKIEQPSMPPFNNEVMRVLKQMPDWTPGKIHDKTCRTLVQLPVTFRR